MYVDSFVSAAYFRGFVTAHSMAYDDLVLNEERAAALFATSGRTSDAVMQQAVPVLAAAELQHRLEGPADTGCAGVSHEQYASIDGEIVVEEQHDEETADLEAGLPDEEFPQIAMPEMHFCADDMTSGDMDEIQAFRKVHAELHELHKVVVAEVRDDVAAGRPVRSRVRALQQAVGAIMPQSVSMKLEQAAVELDSAERGGGTRLPFEAFAVHTGS